MGKRLEVGNSAVNQKAMLSQFVTLPDSELSFILGVDHLLNTRKGDKSALDKILSLSLDTIKLNKGCIYLRNGHNSIHLKTTLGLSANEKKVFRDFCHHQKLLNYIISKKTIVKTPVINTSDEFTAEIQDKLNTIPGVFVPILSQDQEGILFLGDNSNNTLDAKRLAKCQLVAAQIGQMLSFIKRFQLVSASEKRYRSLMENASCCMFIADVDGNLLETNKEGEKLIGCTKSELRGKKFRDFLTPDFRNQLSQWMIALRTNHYITPTAIQIQRVDGAIRTVEGSVVLVDIGRETLFLMIGTDVTEINFLRGKALLNDKLATIGLLAAGVAHEINNPMAWIISNFDVLKEQCAEVHILLKKLTDALMLNNDVDIKEIANIVAQIDESKRFKMIEEILEESIHGAKRIQGIVKDLRNYSRPDTSDFEKIDLHKVIDSAINMAMPEFKYRAHLIRNYANNMPMLNLNEGKIHQVILNLIVNAAHSIEENDVSKNNITLTTFLESSKVGITIADTGRGIESDHLTQIFDPFFTTKPTGSGTGLGLFICHEIIRNLGGEITVKSKLGVGSVFTIYLPLISNVSQKKDNE